MTNPVTNEDRAREIAFAPSWYDGKTMEREFLVDLIASALAEAVTEAQEQIHHDLIMQAQALAERARSGTSVRAELLSVAGFMEDFANDYRSSIRSRTQKETPDV